MFLGEETVFLLGVLIPVRRVPLQAHSCICTYVGERSTAGGGHEMHTELVAGSDCTRDTMSPATYLHRCVCVCVQTTNVFGENVSPRAVCTATISLPPPLSVPRQAHLR